MKHLMKNKLRLFWISIFLLVFAGTANASPITIGTATYEENDYNLIWDDDNNGKSVIWLDYTYTAPGNHGVKENWAAGLDSDLSYTLSAGYSIDWVDGDWRLPTCVNGEYTAIGYDGTTFPGYNITTSELGHLYYEELGNTGRYDTSGNEYGSYDLISGPFANLVTDKDYWFSTQQSGLNYWYFSLEDGLQDRTNYYNGGLAAMPVRSAEVSAVPIPGAAWLLGSGLLGLIGIRRRKQ
jgi:hypothetical protein